MSIFKPIFNRFKAYVQTEPDSTLARHLQWLISGFGILIAIRVMYIQHGWINSDSVLYFEASKLFSAGLWKDGLALYGWPIYSLIIASIHRLSHLDIETSAQFINAIFFGITTFSFISLIRIAGGNSVTILAGGSLLFSSTYIVGDVLPMLLRDEGFWAFFLTSIVFFIRYYRDGNLSNALLWQLYCLIAMLFRVEAITFLMLLPLIFLFQRETLAIARIVKLAKASSITLLALTAVTLIFIFNPEIAHRYLGRLNEFATAISQIFELFNSRAEKYGQHVLGKYLDGYAAVGLAVTLVSIVIIKSIKCAGVIQSLLALFAVLRHRSALKTDAQLIFITVGVIALVNELGIILHGYVLSGRYNIAFAFMVLIVGAFGLDAMIKSANNQQTRLLKWSSLIVFVAICVGLSLNLANKSDHYAYEKETALWVKHNTPAGSSIFYVSPRVRYYAGAPYVGRDYEFSDYVSKAINDGSIHHYDYLVISLNTKNSKERDVLINQLNHHQLIKEFYGTNKNKRILIFSKIPNKPPK